MIERIAKNSLGLAGLALFAALVGAAAFWLFQRAVPASLADVDRGRMEVVVHDYILAHPEILREATQVLRERDLAYTLVDVDSDVPQSVIDAIARIDGVLMVRYLPTS